MRTLEKTYRKTDIYYVEDPLRFRHFFFRLTTGSVL